MLTNTSSIRPQTEANTSQALTEANPTQISSRSSNNHKRLSGGVLEPLSSHQSNSFKQNNSYNRMFNRGQMWKKDSVFSGEGEEQQEKAAGNHIMDFTSAPDIFERNRSRLEKKVSSLTEPEISFKESILQQDFYALHATKTPLNDDEESILSRVQLKKQGKIDSEKKKHTQKMDKKSIASDDFVFFSLETSKEPSKTSSRFGKHGYLFKIEGRPEFDLASITLHDPASPPERASVISDYIRDHIKDLEEETYNELGISIAGGKDPYTLDNDSKETQVYNSMYEVGKDGLSMKQFIALRLIKDIRSVTHEGDKERLLSMTNSEGIGKLINAFYRPQLLVPESIKIKDAILHEFPKESNADFYTESSSSNSD